MQFEFYRYSTKDSDSYGYAENIDSTELSFQNFKLPLKISDNKQLSLDSDNEEIEHFESDHVPFSKIITELDLKYLLHFHENNFYFFIWYQNELIAAAKLQEIQYDSINSELVEVINTIAKFLGFSLLNLSNDFNLLKLKKQLEKQKQKIIEFKNQTIERQNKILRSLMEAMTRLDKTDPKMFSLITVSLS